MFCDVHWNGEAQVASVVVTAPVKEWTLVLSMDLRRCEHHEDAKDEDLFHLTARPCVRGFQVFHPPSGQNLGLLRLRSCSGHGLSGFRGQQVIGQQRPSLHSETSWSRLLVSIALETLHSLATIAAFGVQRRTRSVEMTPIYHHGHHLRGLLLYDLVAALLGTRPFLEMHLVEHHEIISFASEDEPSFHRRC